MAPDQRDSSAVQFVRIDPADVAWFCVCEGWCTAAARTKVLVAGRWMGVAACENEQHIAEAVAEALAMAAASSGS